jgi:tRNA U38,U39,U40 pseudouridine synthase TruA
MNKTVKEKGYDYCVTVINSCETKNQLDDVKNLAENFLRINGENAMAEYLFLQNMIFNKKLTLDNAPRDTK